MNVDVVVVGGGIGGLACAGLLAQKGAQVLLLERSAQLGGRARSTEVEGAWLNLGPHALYERGAGRAVLRALGVSVTGGKPPLSGFALRGGQLGALPFAPPGLLTSTLLSGSGRLALGAFLAKLPLARPTGTLAAWLGDLPEDAADAARALVRVSTYCNAPERLDAAKVAEQLRTALWNVRYLDGGWGSLVDGLAAAAGAAGAILRTEAGVAEVEVGQLRLENGEKIGARDIVVAVPPEAARRLGLPWPENTPVRAACLDLVLDALPRPERRFVLGLDQPLYLSVHTGLAKLSARGDAVLHVAKYLAPGEAITGVEAELESLLDAAQPGWQGHVRARKWRGALPVCGDLTEAGRSRAPLSAGVGLWRVGDGVGEVGMLADAALASASAVAAAIRP